MVISFTSLCFALLWLEKQRKSKPKNPETLLCLYHLKPSYVHGDTYRHNTMKLTIASHPYHKPCQIPFKVCFSVQKLYTVWHWETYFSFFNLTADVDPTKFWALTLKTSSYGAQFVIIWRTVWVQLIGIFLLSSFCSLPGNISGSEAAHHVFPS